ncbi:MAG TPA: DUF2079 domain-containing protein [Polyangia bacterium]|jgi:uncharacterized membrane protein
MIAPDSDYQTRLSYSVRALGLLLAGGVSLGFALGIAILPLSIMRYFQQNLLPVHFRHILLACMIGGGAVAVLAGGLYLFINVAQPKVAARLYHVARRLSPLYLVGFPSLLFRCETWKGHDLPFLILVVLFGLAAWSAVTTSLRAGPFVWEERLWSRVRLLREGFSLALPRLSASLPFWLVLAGAIYYVSYFGYYTYCFYYSLRSGYDLGIYDSLLWNMLHGGSFFKTPPWEGPGRSHFGNHAEFVAYLFLPFYAIRQNAGTLMLIQSAVLGFAAIPLYKLARRHIDRWPACLLALTYLLYPALHGENLFEFHFLPFGPFMLWWAWYFLDARRDRWGAVFVVLTLACREDVSAWVAVLGVYFLLTGRRPRAGLLLAVIGTLYCCTLKFIAMPHVGGGESFIGIYKDLVPQGGKGFGSVVMTVLANPAFTMSTLAEMDKLIYMLQILVPLAFLPFRRPIWLVLAIPGIFFTVLSTHYGALVSINFQYSAHWIAFFFPGVALGLDWMQKQTAATGEPGLAAIKRRAALVTMIAMTLPLSYQFGALFQQTNSWGGPIKYTFGVDAEGRRRHQAAVQLVRHLPPRAKVSGSGFTTPFVSNRPDAYNMTISNEADADYLIFPSEAGDFIGNERETLTRVLRNGDFGVVVVEPPFALAKRGYETGGNAALMARW